MRGIKQIFSGEKMCKLKHFLFLTAFFYLLFGLKTPIPAQETNYQEIKNQEIHHTARTIKVRTLYGKIEATIALSETESLAYTGMSLQEGDNITVHPKSWIILVLENGTIIKVKENSVLTIKKLAWTENKNNEIIQLVLWRGIISIKTKNLLPQDNFQIYTPTAICTVKGTTFSVRVNRKGETLVRTLKGIVGVKKSSGLEKEVLVKDGQQSIVKLNSPPSPPQLVFTSKSVSAAKPVSSSEDISDSEYISTSEPASTPKPVSAPESIPPSQSLPEKKAEPLPDSSSSVEKQTPVTTDTAIPFPTKKVKPQKKALDFTMYGTLGATALIDPDTNQQKVYYKFSLLPEICFGKFGVGLNIVFYFDENNKLRDVDWDDTKDILDKLWYIRYGRKKEILFAYLGGFKDISLGHGLIINRYSNMLQYPEVKQIGAELDLNFGWGGFETIISDIDSNGILGGRIFFRPMYSSGFPLLTNAGLGFSVASDQNPDLNKDTKDDKITIFGADLDIPIFENNLFTFTTYAEGAQMNIGKQYIIAGSKNKGIGYSSGITGSLKNLGIHFQGAYRRLENNFIASYFDSYYDIDRSTKCFTVSPTSGPIKEGPYLELSCNLIQGLETLITYEDFNLPSGNLNYPHIHGELKIDPSLLMNKGSLSFSYDKRDVEKWNDLEKIKGPNTILKTEIGYFVDTHICLLIIYQQTFDLYGNPTENTSIETRIQF